MVGLGDGLGLLDFLTAGDCLMSWKPLPRWAIFLLGVYLGAGVVTFGFQMDACTYALASAHARLVSVKAPCGLRSGQPIGLYILLAIGAQATPPPQRVAGGVGRPVPRPRSRTAGRVLQPYLGNGRS